MEALNQICDHTMLRFRVLFSSRKKVKNDLVNSSEKMQQFWQAVSLAKIGEKRDGGGREKKPINCLFRPKALANSVNHILEQLNLVLQ